MAPPIVEVNDSTVFINNTISAGNLFSATDPDDAIASYIFEDFQTGANTGYFRLNGVAFANGSSFTIQAADLTNLDYIGGSQISFEGFRVIARDDFGNFSSPLSTGILYSVRSNISAPHVRAPFFTALANETVDGADIIFGFDPDGYPMTHFEISEANPVIKTVSANGFVTATIFKHNFTQGDTITLEGANESQYNRTSTVNVLNQHTIRFPVPGIADGVATGTMRAFSQDGGRFTLNGAALAQGVDFVITADQVQDLKYLSFGNTDDENIYVRGYDGVDWSTKKRGVASRVINANRPVVQFSNATTPADQFLSLDGQFLVTDADQNSIKFYQFFNTSPHARKGDLIFKGAIMPRTTWFTVFANDLDQLNFQTHLVGDEQQIRIRAHDGKHLSVPGTLTIRSTPPIVRPDLENNQPVLVTEQLVGVQIAPLFSQADPGPPHTRVQAFEPTTDPDSGTLRFSQTPLLGGEIHEFSKAEFDFRVNFYTGDFLNRHLDTVYVREQNLTSLWSPWQKIDISTEPEYEDALTTGTTWVGLMPINSAGKIEITYSYMQLYPLYGSDAMPAEAVQGAFAEQKHFSILSQQQRINSRLAFRHLEQIVNVQFVEIPDTETNVFGGRGGIIRMGEYGADNNTSVTAYSTNPAFSDFAGDMWFNRLFLGLSGASHDFQPGSFGYRAFLRTLGVTMGLKSPGGLINLPPSTDGVDFTVMGGRPSFAGEPTTYQLYDVDELQELYGANTATRAGNNGYSIFNFWGGQFNFHETIWDGGGNDTLSAVGAPRSAVVDLRSGQKSSIGNVANNVTISFGADIENALGSRFGDELNGNVFDNYIDGRKGDDYLFGNAGNDFLIGGEGNDTFEWGVGDGNDIINEGGGGGTDTIVFTDFPTADRLGEDFKFRLVGSDMFIDLELDGGARDASIKIVGQTTAGNRIETFELRGTRIDLANLTSQVAVGVDSFVITTQTTEFGNLVVPV